MIAYRHGSIEADHDPAYFRLYANPQNRRTYMLLKKTDVLGDLYEWTTEETRQAGLVGAKRYRVTLKVGTEVQEVFISVRKLGETTTASTARRRQKRDGAGKKPRDPSICCCEDSACTQWCIGFEEGSCGEFGMYPCNPSACE